MLAGIGPATLRKIASLQGFQLSDVESLGLQVPALARALASPLAWEIAKELAEKQVDLATTHQARIISALDPDYPHLLKATKDDPFLLFVKGSLFTAPSQSVAIIGTRQPTKHGELIARRVTEFFVEQNWSVVSGLALGCDGIAHKAALEARGHTVAVMAHGLQTVAPSQHRKLAEAILASGGALVSEYRFGQGALPMQFVKRDRTQAGLAQGVVMIQSDIKGGSLHASRAALDYERWLAVPFPTDADLAANEPKIQANLLIADSGADIERATLLKCHRSRLAKIIVLRTKEDYREMVSVTFDDNVVAEAGAAVDEDLSQTYGIRKREETEISLLITSEEVALDQDQLEVDASTQKTVDRDLLDHESSPEQARQVDKETSAPQAVTEVGVVEPASVPSKKSKAKSKKKAAPKSELTVQQSLL
ncbi:DNA-protecting protein DprA [Pseudomonas seleniipraecipitans]|uniref:DNA-protecting protein DprA n=2 Tax=Phytopseudomonas seleniipraecipitans TaxID=640205 RepID=A0ABY5JEL6_9GAMM|nr:DNA-protecting protein DprA [Pseudomonas seleniipraecipitans]